jgi:SAM-dependent methyltransferase
MTFDWTTRICPVCGSSKEARVHSESNIDPGKLTEFAFASRKLPEYMHPRLIVCAGCGLLYGNPVISSATIAALYREAAYDSTEESHYASVTYAKVLQKHLPDLPNLEGAMDIGTGDGAFLEQLIALKFSHVIGVEPSTAPIEAARPEIRPHIVHDLFRASDFTPSSFSLVTCFQVMEHFWDPMEITRQACTLLKPGGLFLSVVHNLEALSAKMLGTKSPIFDVEHLQLFDKNSGRQMLERAGLTSIRTYTFWNRYPLQYWMRLFPIPPAVKGPAISTATAIGLGALQISLPAGNLVLAGFKP